MRIGEALRRLDDRVLGTPKPATAATHRKIFFVGSFGALAVLTFAISTGESTAFAAVGGLLASMIISGVRWVRTRQSERAEVPVAGPQRTPSR